MKAEESSSAAQYANAILQIAESKGNADLVFQNLNSICQVISQKPEFSIVMKHPAIAEHEKKSLLENTFKKDMDELSLRLLEMLTERRRLHLLPFIRDQFQELLNAKKNIAKGVLICAEAMDNKAIEDVKKKLQTQLGKTLELEVKVDRSLIGGFILKVGDQVIDGSLRGRLHSIEKSLLSV